MGVYLLKCEKCQYLVTSFMNIIQNTITCHHCLPLSRNVFGLKDKNTSLFKYQSCIVFIGFIAFVCHFLFYFQPTNGRTYAALIALSPKPFRG